MSTDANGNPWANGLSTSTDSQYVYVNFNPCGICDVSPCDSIMFVTVIQPQKQISGQLQPATYAEQGFPDAPELDAQLTAAGYAVDAPPGVSDPYCLPSYRGVPLYSVGFRDGSCHAAECTDNPRRELLSFKPNFEKIVLSFEVNALCIAGGGAGQWLGGSTFSWERPQVAPGVLGPERWKFGGFTRELPSRAFLDALNLWQSLHQNFALPIPQSPTSGGITCN